MRRSEASREATFPFVFFFSAKRQACGPDARTLRGKSIGPVISDCGFRISDFLVFFFNPHSAFYIPHLGCPPGPRNETRLMVFARNALASGPGNA
jgi:hypothetical protein